MRKKFACADFTFPLLPHDKVLDLIALLDFKGVDIGLFQDRSHLQPFREYRQPARSGGALGTKLRDRGLQAADIFLQAAADFEPRALNHPDDKIRREVRTLFQKTLEYAVAAGSKHVTVLPGVHFKSEKRPVSLARCVDELAWRVQQAKSAGLTLGTEAHVGSIVPSPQEAAELISLVPGLTLSLDYTHFTRLGLPDEAVEPLVPLASHFHVRGARKGRLQTKFQDNTIDYTRVLQVMAQSGYKGWLGIEYVWIDWEGCNEVDNLSETIQFRDFLKSAVV